MIDLMAATGGTADRPEPVRQAGLSGGEAAGPEQGQDMFEVMRQLAAAYRAAEEAAPLEEAGEMPAAQADQLPVASADPSRSTVEVRSGPDLSERQIIGTAWRDPGESAEAAAALAGNLPLEQVEQWLGEQRQLQAQHGALQSPEKTAVEEPRTPPNAWNHEVRRLVMPAGAAIGAASNAAPAVAASDGGHAMPQEVSRIQLDVLAQSVRSEDAPLQMLASRSGEAAGTIMSTPAQPSGAAAVPAEVRLHGPEARWGEQMLQALRDQVEMQVSQRSQQATIRLDPPELGSLNIQISHEQGKLSVHINAAQTDVARLLGLLSERLRHELIGQNFTEVSVGVGSGAEQGKQGRQRQASHFAGESIGAAREVAQQPDGGNHGPASDILISV